MFIHGSVAAFLCEEQFRQYFFPAYNFCTCSAFIYVSLLRASCVLGCVVFANPTDGALCIVQ